MKKRFLFWFACLAFCLPSHAQTPAAGKSKIGEEQVAQAPVEVPQQVQVIKPGGVIYIRSPKFDTPNYQSKLGQTKAIIIPRENYDDIYAGIDVDTIPGEYLLSIETSKKQLANYPFIVPVPDEITFIEQPSPRFLPDKKETIKKLLWSNISPILPFNFPVYGSWSQTFGHYYETTTLTNKKNKQNLQRIDDISIKINGPASILSPSDAVCFLITFKEESGYTVLLDHGMGLFSEISGLTNLSISEQDRVLKNALIANFNVDDLKNENNEPITRQINWRVFLNKAVINPFQLTSIQ